MRDFASCFGEHALQLQLPAAAASCTSRYSSGACVSPALDSPPSVQNSVTCLYRTVLPRTRRRIFIALTWGSGREAYLSHGLSIAFSNDSVPPLKLETSTGLFRKSKGAKTVDFNGTSIELTWDLTAARYGSGPEPIDGFFILIAADSEPLLLLGDKKTNKHPSPAGVSSLISRQEHFFGRAMYSTRARFSDAGNSHSILIRCCVEGETAKSPVLCVSIDTKPVILVKRLRWNFRGNQTIFLDGLQVDLLWDLHDWFSHSRPGCARFLFRPRTGVDSRLWLEQSCLQGDDEKLDFSLMIYAYACNSAPL